MKIGVIGAGAIGGTVGTLWAKAGHEVFFSSRHPEKLTDLLAITGSNTQAGTVNQAAAFADVIFLAVYYHTTDDAISAAGSLDGKIIIDATNAYIRHPDGRPIRHIPNVSSALELAQKVPYAKVVKAYNTLAPEIFAHEHHNADPYALFYCGDDAAAKAIVAQLIVDSGFMPIDTGDLSNVIHQEPDGMFFDKPLVVDAARELLALVLARSPD
ncbi:putative dinucleotide-binding enzyme [Cylindrospermum stagnale PCC 7417]|uniref:Putative dinucleotide-binding enzyme n=1 Tax=Cylindrospermum stagnale PCC 7417 TaxID=56107 RepID=K9X7Y0_9NOST|nr:NAD(P)-binding domain-containing protein [Cylindrospermum stagnale]AFZ28186.1 putative dinucleotide-binding enzyme [Cylindrospermum stagnale PCC 7417]